MSDVFFVILLAILGAVLGSFYACMGYRIPNKIKLSFPNSFCENCKKPLKWYMNIPIFSYIFLGGKCKYCKTRINPLSFLTEVLTSLLFVISYMVFGLSFKFYIAIILVSALSVTLISDFIYYYISDRVVFISLFLVLLMNVLFNGLTNVYIPIINAVAGFILIYAIKLFGDKVFKKESLGGGDIKLVALIGSAIGFINLILCLGIASLTGLLFALFAHSDDKSGIVPFGPFLLVSALLVWFLNINLFK